MSIKRAILFALTLLVSTLMSLQLLSSWTEPQAQSQLNLYQSDLLLQASQWDGLDQVAQGSPSLRSSFMGDNPIQDALKNYQSVRASAQKDLDRVNRKGNRSKLKSSLSERPVSNPKIEKESGSKPVQSTSSQLIDELDLRLGILYTKAKNQDKALQIWTQLINTPHSQRSVSKQVITAQILKDLWSDPSQILPEAEQILTRNLNGWFRFQSLSRLYNLQQRQGTLQSLEVAEQETAMSAFLRLLMVGSAPVLGGAIGFTVLISWGLRALLNRKKTPFQKEDAINLVANTEYSNGSGSITTAIAPEQGTPSTQTPTNPSGQGIVLWPTETIWQVMVLWFTAFFGVSLILPITLVILGFHPETFDGRMQGYFALFSYVCLMGVGFGILQFSLRRFIPNVLKWLRLRWSGNWLAWGLGGYFVALPLVLMVSLLNQKLLNEQGGGNPILEIILQSHDSFTIGLLWFLVAVCAPLFEESLFRGFFLTSLTRYLPTGSAIALSAFLFALAHLNLGDLLPLTVLGMILGFVYSRSRNLLASMLLHSLWNSGSFIGLLILGSSST
jgi:uncharacterized protein